jgi:hypothetical protein
MLISTGDRGRFAYEAISRLVNGPFHGVSFRFWQILLQKSFGVANENPRAADASYARRREGPYRFSQNRSRIFVVA